MSQSGTERTTVQTYVPADQKEQWVADADSMDMSLSEFVRTMVQAGRRGFADRLEVATTADDGRESESSESSESSGSSDGSEPAETPDDGPDEEPGSPGPDPRGRDLETVVLDELRDGPRDYDELVEECLTDVRESVANEVEGILQELQAANRVTHSPRAGGYTIVDDE